MSVRKNKHNTYTVSVYNLSGKKISRNFKFKRDAVAFESKIQNDKRENKLIASNIKNAEVTFEQAISDFMNPKHNLRKKTVDKYNFFFKQFKIFLDSFDINYVSEFSPDHATRLFQELTKPRVLPQSNTTVVPKPKTVNGFLTVIRAFFNWEVMVGHIVKSPMIHVHNLKVDKGKPDYYTEEELESFFSQEMADTYRLAFRGLFYTGMRIEELVNVHWTDVDFDKKLIRVSRKPGFIPKTSNSERSIPIAKPLYDDLQKKYINKDSETYVFTSVGGRRLSSRTLLGVCKSVASSAGITSRAFLHKFRHTFATHLVRNRVPLERVQKLLGHSSINETLIYAHLISSDMHEDISVLNNLC